MGVGMGHIREMGWGRQQVLVHVQLSNVHGRPFCNSAEPSHRLRICRYRSLCSGVWTVAAVQSHAQNRLSEATTTSPTCKHVRCSASNVIKSRVTARAKRPSDAIAICRCRRRRLWLLVVFAAIELLLFNLSTIAWNLLRLRAPEIGHTLEACRLIISHRYHP